MNGTIVAILVSVMAGKETDKAEERPMRVLCVEDDPDIQAITRFSLEVVGGFQVSICASGEEALDKVRSFSPELILLDVKLPGMDGPSTLEALQEMPETASIPVVFITASAQGQEIESYRKTGAIDVISKPFDPMSLPGTLIEILNGIRNEKQE
jgi:CheY-like chemotaxis protein